MRHLMSREMVQEMKVPQMTRVLKLQKMEKVIHHMTTETQMIQMYRFLRNSGTCRSLRTVLFVPIPDCDIL